MENKFLCFLGIDNTSSNLSSTSSPTSPTIESKKNETINLQAEFLCTIEKKYTNSTHEVLTATLHKSKWDYYSDGVAKHLLDDSIAEEFVPIDDVETPSLLPQQPNKTWTLAGSKGASIKVQLSAELIAIEFGSYYINTTKVELPNVNETHVTGDCDGEIRNMKISWKSFDTLNNNSIDMSFKKLDNVYNLHRINMTVFSQNVTNLASHDLINKNISDCNGINETCNYNITVKTIKMIDNHRIAVKLTVYDMEFHITENTYEFEYTLFGICAVIGFVLVILIELAIYKSIKTLS
ncbi:uncharacterized protein LOC122849441 [Aphidius gifuensis]|uniref:uncharacterized protein LOC122849441 n=1 Tax=Aphidius gifuensis TaxID=684658 RepID=UPI001CDBF0AF|nr:uncharacterized protein LOC122849441 [Aphidius gifuensis]